MGKLRKVPTHSLGFFAFFALSVGMFEIFPLFHGHCGGVWEIISFPKVWIAVYNKEIAYVVCGSISVLLESILEKLHIFKAIPNNF